jgi:hypothetical protein
MYEIIAGTEKNENLFMSTPCLGEGYMKQTKKK